MAIPSETIDQIRLATDIVELVREYVPGLKRVGRNWKACCPFHHEKTPSFMVNGEKGIFHCFGCSAGGDIFKFVMQMDGLSWPEAVKKLANRAGVTVRETQEDIVRRSEKQKIYDLLAQAAQFYHRVFKESSEAKAARVYMEKRGVSKETIDRFQIGYAPRGQLLTAAGKKGFTPEQFIAAGIMTRTERGRLFEYMSERVVFPIYDTQGRVVAFGGRTLKDEQPKYLNTPETDVYSKSQQLYGLYQAIPRMRHSRDAVILEGYMDVVVCHQYGVDNTVAALGTALTTQQAQMLKRYVDNIVLLFDPDSAGMNAARRAIETLLDLETVPTVAYLPDGLDPDEYLLRSGTDAFREWLKANAVSAIAFATERALAAHGSGSPEAKMKVAAEVLTLIGRAKNAVLRQEWVRYLAERLQTTETALVSELKRQARPEPAKPAGKTAKPAPAKSVVRSSEEELLQILAAYPQCVQQVNAEAFKEPRNRKVFTLLAQGVPVSEIMPRLDEADAGWFTEIMLEERSYAAPEQVVVTIVRDMRQRELAQQRQEIENEVMQMINGTVPADPGKIARYNDLTRQLKGSVRE